MGLFGKKKEVEAPREVPHEELPPPPEHTDLLKLPELPEEELPELPRTHEVPAEHAPPPHVYEKGAEPPKHIEVAKPMATEQEPIFIKITKFKDSLAQFEKIKEKISDIEEALDKIKEVRAEEETELGEWEDEVRAIKEKVDSIDSSLFSKVK